MFNIENAISEWRSQMLAAGVKAPAPLDELELHLRDELERAGTAIDQKTFDAAVRQLGQPVSIRSEFRKIERQTMKRKIIIGIAVLAFLFGTGIILPALARHNHRNPALLSSGTNVLGATWATDEVVPLCIGFAIALGGIAAGVNAVKNGKKAHMA